MPVRLLTAHSRTLPQFLIIGAQRGGTTSLYTYLSEHPQILRAARKEVHFFDLHFHEGVKWYRAHFPMQSRMTRKEETVGRPILTGEATPYYLFHPEAPQRIAALLPGVRLIVLLRNPIARAYSHYMFTVGGGRDRMSFKEAVRWERERVADAIENGKEMGDCYGSRDHLRHSYLARGVYVLQLRTYFELFDRKDVYVGSSEELFRNPQAVYDDILNFLGLESHKLRNNQPRNIGLYDSALEKTDDDLCHELRAFFDPFNRDLYKLLGTDFHWED